MGNYRMKDPRLQSNGRHGGKRHSGGFTLIASLLMLLLLSGIAIGLLMMANTESKVGGTDLQNNIAYHVAEGGIEKMYSDLSAVFQNSQAPSTAQICAVSNTPPTMVGVAWNTYSVAPTSGCGTSAPVTPTATWKTLTGGPEAGLWAQVIPVNMQATAAMSGGQEVSMTRTAQVALIPVFQFGVFSESDLSFFSGPSFDMAGPIQTNADLYAFVGPGSTLTFHNQVSTYGNVIRYQLANGYDPTTNYNGTVYIPTTNNGCSAPVAPSTALTSCVAMDTPRGSYNGDASVVGAGGNPPVSAYNTSNWPTFSGTTTAHEMINGNFGSTTNLGTGAKKLSMPFVGGGAMPYQIIRRPPSTESATSALGLSREYNLAQIHVLLADDPAELPGGASDTNNVRLANITAAQAPTQGGSAAASNAWGITIASPNYSTTFGTPTASHTYNLYFAAASNAVPIPANCAGFTCPVVGTNAANGSDWPYAPAQWAENPSPSLQGLQPAPIAPSYLTNGAAPTINLCPPTNLAAGATPAQPANCPTTGAYPYFAPPNASGATTYNSASSNAWSLIDGYLRVEYKDTNGVWHPVTNEWLQLGFARGQAPPATSGSNPITPNAILLLQEPADRSTTGSLSASATPPNCTSTNSSGKCKTWTAGTPPQLLADLASVAATSTYVDWAFGLTPTAPVASPVASATPQSLTQYNWYPINFYDAREGEVRDNQVADNSCSTNGVMNAVEIDVGNLKRWLAGTTGSSATSVDYLAQNGYVLYFSDRRGMLLNPHVVSPNAANTKTGDSGLEDVINASSASGTPDAVLESPTANSPEDVNGNGVLDNFGPANMGLGFTGTVGSATQNLNAQIVAASPDDPFSTAAGARIASCSNTGRKNWVSGA